MKFPSLSVRNLQGVDVDLPAAFDGEWNIVAIAFDRNHQVLVDSWTPWAESLVDSHAGVRFFEVPTISRRWAPFRRMIDGGMASAIKVPKILQRTLTYYGDVAKVTKPLEIADRSTIVVVLLDQAGTVRARSEGSFSEGAADDFRSVMGIPAPPA